MKKITSIFCALMMLLSVNAAPLATAVKKQAAQKIEVKKAPRMEKFDAKAVLRAPKAQAATELTSGTLYTVSGKFYNNTSSGWADYTSKMPSITVTVDGTNVTIAGLAYWFPDGAVKGTLDGNTLTIPSGQLVGTDAYGDEFLVGSNDGSTVADIVFVWDADKAELSASTKYIMENSAAESVAPYAYWISPVFSAEAPAAPEVVVLPTGATVVEYTMDYINPKDESKGAKSINVAVVEDNVYFQGMSQYLPEAWVIGKKAGNEITFAANQYMGDYGTNGSSYFFYEEAVFTYDSEADTYSATGEIFGLLDDYYYDGRYKNPVLSKAKGPDWDNPIEVVMTEAESVYDEEYEDVTYSLSNATNDTIFQFDIYLEEGQKDVVAGQKYTFADMESSATYTYVSIGGSKIGLKSVDFVKTVDGETGLARIEATVLDAVNNVFHIVYQEVPFTPSGEEVNLFFEVAMEIPQYYEEEDYETGSWLLGTVSLSEDTLVQLNYLSANEASPAGSFTEEDLILDYSYIKLNGEKIELKLAEIAVTDNSERTDVVAKLVGKDRVTYNVKMFFIKPAVVSQETITSDALQIDPSYLDWYGIVILSAEDDKNAISINLNAEELGAGLVGDYVAGKHFNGIITPAGTEDEIDIYSGSINIAYNSGIIVVTGKVLAMNNVEYTLNLTFKPSINDLTMTASESSYTASTSTVRYKLSNDTYTFIFRINLPEGQEDVEAGKSYSFTEDMGGNTNGSYGYDTEYNFIDYAEATFVKNVTADQIEIKATVVDLTGNIWNLTYTEKAEGINNTNAAVKTTKRLVNGQLVIEKNGVKYNVTGTVLK